MNDPENALRAFKQSTRLSPDDPIVLLNSTTCLLNCGMRQEAEELLNRCKDLQETGKMVGVNEEVGESNTCVVINCILLTESEESRLCVIERRGMGIKWGEG